MDIGKAEGRAQAEAAIQWQAQHCDTMQAPLTAGVLRALLPLLAGGSACAQRMRSWPQLTSADAMPLRLAGGLHHLHLSGAEAGLGPVYRGELADQAGIDAAVAAAVARHDAALLRWFDSPPQTNEAGRSASLMAGLMWLAARLGPRFELNEIGASAGANTMIERYAYDLGGVRCGPAASPVLIRPEWRGAPPPAASPDILHIEGCDQAPVNLADPAEALRLRAFVWAENTQRMARLEAVAALASARPPRLARADAADWVAARLATAQPDDSTRVLYHSIVWQYLPEPTKARITAAMEAAGARATPARRLAWLRLETNRTTFRHELRLRIWAGAGEEEEAFLATAHAHGAWVEWLA